jgi:hypothetical protein
MLFFEPPVQNILLTQVNDLADLKFGPIGDRMSPKLGGEFIRFCRGTPKSNTGAPGHIHFKQLGRLINFHFNENDLIGNGT